MDEHRTALFLFMLALAATILVATVTTLRQVGTRVVSNDVPAGTTGLARPHPPLDRAPGQPLERPR
ncbi:hypothetical protein [Bradyrhizobium lablabi]|uniref:hypothetical protein n=1 Tax=Bradyrhizobium lablabi TaxID=722472 RepID=UPI001BAA91C3|nr:hypothetical protein [Bradyrhizobium lablabi]MBR0697735.1 hypothetical protein [Bradyrhizobium lablabi]